ncbi:unnamed protein product [Didymodactylos carnosus]|uniref:Integrase zinc-binding domain-containing protein n=1 Tax=Didymodactylos carnosus TaxID=1234261 RepID=A0A814GZC3_9BILA|nr:unnamed protein product [Didymodactylos carnosus]CAF1500183.1 unnamed protein product [Didymodactylos carnosus]CAF3773935.1 unnamed protein product [Didymodactylos carnosus]CAF4288671.1 unnamed protein product [Didymodactylos carnosus]
MSRYPATTSNDQITSRNVRGIMNDTLIDDEEETNPQVNVITRAAAKAITSNNNNKTIALTGNHTKSPKPAQTMTPYLSTTAMQLRPRNKIINPKTSIGIPSTSLPAISKVSTATPSTDFDITKLKMEQQQDTVILDKIKETKQDPTILSYEVVDGLLYKIASRKGAKDVKLPYLPQSMIPKVMAAYHDHPTSGHFGIRRTRHKLKDRYFWPSMMSTIENYNKSCEKCAKFNIRRTKAPGKLHPITPPEGIFETIGMDFFGSNTLSIG